MIYIIPVFAMFIGVFVSLYLPRIAFNDMFSNIQAVVFVVAYILGAILVFYSGERVAYACNLQRRKLRNYLLKALYILIFLNMFIFANMGGWGDAGIFFTLAYSALAVKTAFEMLFNVFGDSEINDELIPCLYQFGVMGIALVFYIGYKSKSKNIQQGK